LTTVLFAAGALQLTLAGIIAIVLISADANPPLQATVRRLAELSARTLPTAPDAAALEGLRTRAGFALVVLLDSAGSELARAGAPPTSPFRLVEEVPLEHGRTLRVTWIPEEPVSPRPLIALLLTFVASGAVSLLLGRWVLSPVRAVASAAHRLGEGALSARTGVTRHDELGQLAQAFDRMAERLGTVVLAQGELVANVSHELRTPLARMRVALDLAAEGLSPSQEAYDELSRDLAELESLVGTLVSTARDALSERRPLDGLGAAKREPVAVTELVAACREHVARRHPARTLLVEGPLDGTFPADASLLGRALFNLLDNAFAYSDGEVRLVLDTTAGDLSFAVVDTGLGMTPEDAARAFEPFFRSDRSRSRATGGLGLGLSLVRRIAQAHGGRAWLESSLGHGTTVTLTLPRS
jgi:signal transduction histidine kinase